MCRKFLKCKTDFKCSVSKFENDVCYNLDDENPQLLKADDIYSGNLLVRIDLILQYVQGINLQGRFALADLDDRILVIEAQLSNTETYSKMNMNCDENTKATYDENIIPRHTLDQMRYDS